MQMMDLYASLSHKASRCIRESQIYACLLIPLLSALHQNQDIIRNVQTLAPLHQNYSHDLMNNIINDRTQPQHTVGSLSPSILFRFLLSVLQTCAKENRTVRERSACFIRTIVMLCIKLCATFQYSYIEELMSANVCQKKMSFWQKTCRFFVWSV